MYTNKNKRSRWRLVALFALPSVMALGMLAVSMACDPSPVGALEVKPEQVICPGEEVLIGWWLDAAKSGRIRFKQNGQVIKDFDIPPDQLGGGFITDTPASDTTYLLQGRSKEGGSWKNLDSQTVIVVSTNTYYDIAARGQAWGDAPLQCNWINHITDLLVSPSVRVATVTNNSPVMLAKVEHQDSQLSGSVTNLGTWNVTNFFSGHRLLGTWALYPDAQEMLDWMDENNIEHCQNLLLEVRAKLYCEN